MEPVVVSPQKALKALSLVSLAQAMGKKALNIAATPSVANELARMSHYHEVLVAKDRIVIYNPEKFAKKLQNAMVRFLEKPLNGETLRPQGYHKQHIHHLAQELMERLAYRDVRDFIIHVRVRGVIIEEVTIFTRGVRGRHIFMEIHARRPYKKSYTKKNVSLKDLAFELGTIDSALVLYNIDEQRLSVVGLGGDAVEEPLGAV